MEEILLIDDDEGLTHFLNRFFKRKGYDVTTCLNGREAIEAISRKRFDLILLDYKMPELNGLDTLKQIKAAQVKTPVIIMTAYGTTDTAIEAMKRGAYDYLNKPFERDELSRVVGEALELNQRMQEVVHLPDAAVREHAPTPKGALKIIGRSKAMQSVYKTIGRVAEKNVSVLITGESGTGKELVAKAIFHHSRRKNRPFMAINCAAIPENLFESELFGYEPGAFTGAQRIKLGKMERCDGGTCFLDEIGDMSMALQAKLLRVLQEGEFERVGGKEPLYVDVRIIAATNKDLTEEVRQHRFREDLYWRLKVITIQMPPLRERPEDIPDLVDCFTQRFSLEYAKSVQHVSEPVLAMFRKYAWPGNVRELENCIRRAVILCTGDVITEEHIELSPSPKDQSVRIDSREELMCQLKEKLQTVLPEIVRLSESGVHANIIEMVEEIIILNVLEESGNNQVKAAQILGISRNTLRQRLKKYGAADPH